MRVILLWLIIGAIAIVSGIAVLTNTIDIKSQQMGVFFISCENNPDNCNKRNSTGLISSAQSDKETVESATNPWAAQREYSAMVATNDFDTPQGNDDNVATDSMMTLDDSDLENSNQGCPVSFWIKQSDYQNVSDSRLMWPQGYLPEDKFGSTAYFNTKITISSTDNPSLIDALNSENDGIDKLVRQSVAALLNAAHPKVKYPLTITEVISLTNDAIVRSNYSIADTFAKYNNLGNSDLCS
ncbi:MAG: hypothetical protein HW410_1343 [Nitrosarchaeum sp.]|nr:hypothetical protein [Nitrosarchaeum sp.]